MHKLKLSRASAVSYIATSTTTRHGYGMNRRKRHEQKDSESNQWEFA